MLTDIYIEALLVDPELADAIWRLWIDGLIDDNLAMIVWLISAA